MNRKRLGTALAVALVALLVVGGAVLVRQAFFGPKTISALFTSVTGIYPGDEVRVSGVQVGTIESVTPEGTQARLTLRVDRGVEIPAEAKAIIVAQNLVAARYVQLTPAYRSSGPTLPDGAEIGLDRTAVPVEWDQVKEQLMRMATDLGPQSGVDGTSVSRFIESAANALDGNGEKLHETITQLSGVARILAEGSGNIVDVIKNLQVFVTALKDSNVQVVSFQNRLATLTSVVDGSRDDLDAALTNLSVAVGEVQRFVAGSRNQTSEQVQRLADVTSNLVEEKQLLAVQNLLHVAPNAFNNGYNIYNPDTGSAVGQFVFHNMSNPLQFICGAIGAIENTTAPVTAKLCAQQMGPALRLLNFNNVPFPIQPYLSPSANPENIVYSEPNLAPGGGGGVPGPSNTPPELSAYNPGPAPPPPFTGRPPGTPPPGAQQLLPGAPPVVQPNVPSSVRDLLNPATTMPPAQPPGPLPAETPAAPGPLPAEGTPPA